MKQLARLFYRLMFRVNMNAAEFYAAEGNLEIANNHFNWAVYWHNKTGMSLRPKTFIPMGTRK